MWKYNVGTVIGLCAFCSSVASANTASVNVVLNTSALAANSADAPYSIEFQLQNGFLVSNQLDGGPFTNPSNVVTISNFTFGGGAALDPATLDTFDNPIFFTQGGVSGDLESTVNLFANVPLTVFDQGFTPGTLFGFTVTYTNNVADADIFDIFSFSILDNNYTELPTQGGDLGAEFMQIDFDSDTPNISTFASDPTTPSTNDLFYTIDAPIVTDSATPEPNMFWLLGLGLVLLSFRKRFSRNLRSCLPGTLAILSLLAFDSHRLDAAPPPSPEVFVGIYRGVPVTYQIINGFAVVEGDMVIGTATVHTDRAGRRNATLNTVHPESNSVNIASALWPKVAGVVTVPYTFIHGQTVFMPAINAFNTLFAGQFKWVPRTNQRAYVEIDLNNQSTNACYATLGYTGGKESLQGVAAGCGLSANMHEMGHTMGLAHEQSRVDRNSYISIDFSNIAPASQSQYAQDPFTNMDLGLYDYVSLMHYAGRGFTRNGNPEMESIPVGMPFGDPPTFSTGDIDALNRLYFTAPTNVTITSNPSGLPIIVDGSNYTAPQTFTMCLRDRRLSMGPATSLADGIVIRPPISTPAAQLLSRRVRERWVLLHRRPLTPFTRSTTFNLSSSRPHHYWIMSLQRLVPPAASLPTRRPKPSLG
jgi:hypothetical protein